MVAQLMQDDCLSACKEEKLPPETFGDVDEGVALRMVDAIETLISGAGFQRTEFRAPRAQFYVVEQMERETLWKILRGQLLAARIPAYAKSRMRLAHCRSQGCHCRRVVVAALNAYAGDCTIIRGCNANEAFGSELFAHIAPEILAVASGAMVGAKTEIDGQRHLVWVFLKYNVVIDVFKHGERA